MTTKAPPIPAHFAYVQHGKGDDTRLAFVKPSVFAGKVLCRFVRESRGRQYIGVQLRSADAILRAATNIDLDEVCTLAGILAERGIDRKVIQEAMPR